MPELTFTGPIQVERGGELVTLTIEDLSDEMPLATSS